MFFYKNVEVNIDGSNEFHEIIKEERRKKRLFISKKLRRSSQEQFMRKRIGVNICKYNIGS